jgi:hypothetical protein
MSLRQGKRLLGRFYALYGGFKRLHVGQRLRVLTLLAVRPGLRDAVYRGKETSNLLLGFLYPPQKLHRRFVAPIFLDEDAILRSVCGRAWVLRFGS